MIVAGIDCLDGATPQLVAEAITAAVEQCGVCPSRLEALATGATIKEASVINAARALSLPLIFVTSDAMVSAVGGAERIPTEPIVVPLYSSIAERAALAAAGPNARLLGPIVAVQSVTCAVAEGTRP